MKTSNEPPITVVIPTWNRIELLVVCLSSLRHQTVPCRIIVVDNGSIDATPGVIARQFPEVEYLRLETNQGFARAANRGIERTNTRLVALLNNDTETAPRWIEAGLAVFEDHPRCGIVASRMLDYWRRDRLDSAGDRYSCTGMASKRGNGGPADSFLRPEPVLSASAGAAFYRREVFEKSGSLTRVITCTWKMST
jgi:GT2 family glycosyltransferase